MTAALLAELSPTLKDCNIRPRLQVLSVSGVWECSHSGSEGVSGFKYIFLFRCFMEKISCSTSFSTLTNQKAIQISSHDKTDENESL